MAFGMGATFGGISGAMFAAFQGFVSPESFSLMESVMIVAMVVLGGLGHLPGVILGAVLLAALPEALRYVAGPLQEMTGGRLDAAILRQLLISVAMVGVMLWRPSGLWPKLKNQQHPKSLASRILHQTFYPTEIILHHMQHKHRFLFLFPNNTFR